jgi:hypothetical protein
MAARLSALRARRTLPLGGRSFCICRIARMYSLCVLLLNSLPTVVVVLNANFKLVSLNNFIILHIFSRLGECNTFLFRFGVISLIVLLIFQSIMQMRNAILLISNI